LCNDSQTRIFPHESEDVIEKGGEPSSDRGIFTLTCIAKSLWRSWKRLSASMTCFFAMYLENSKIKGYHGAWNKQNNACQMGIRFQLFVMISFSDVSHHFPGKKSRDMQNL
jgi:hypothetical protein